MTLGLWKKWLTVCFIGTITLNKVLFGRNCKQKTLGGESSAHFCCWANYTHIFLLKKNLRVIDNSKRFCQPLLYIEIHTHFWLPNWLGAPQTYSKRTIRFVFFIIKIRRRLRCFLSPISFVSDIHILS